MSEKLGKGTGLFSNPVLRRLVGQNFSLQWRKYAVAICAMIVVAVTTSATAYIMKDIVDTMSMAGNRDNVFVVAATVAGIFIVKGIATYIQTVKMTEAGLRTIAHQQQVLYARLLDQGLAFFGKNNSSTLVLRVTNGATAARQVTDLIVTSFARDLLSVIGLIGVMIYQQPFLSIFALLVGPISLAGVRLLLGKSRKMADLEQSSLGEIIRVMQETAGGIRVIKAFSLENRMQDRMAKAVDEVENRGIAFTRLQAITSPMMDTLSGFAIAGIVALSAVDFLGLERTTPGALMSFVTALLMAYEPAKRLLRVRMQIERALIAVSGMFELIDSPVKLLESPEAKPLPQGNGEVIFDAVKFGYAAKKPVLQGISHRFEPGKTTALVGPSGGGKSTILNLMMRLYDPLGGQITIDGMDIRQATFASLRQKMSIVSQDTFLFSSSIMENLRVGRSDATDEEVIAAAKVAHAHDFIMETPKGYQTQVGENGSFLSGGQKQRLAIARAVLRRAPILLLDEATSALDATSESLVQDAITEVTRDTTTIVIAHRLSTILTADCICYVQGGVITEKGTLAELLALNGGFAKLYNEQFKNAL